MCEVEIGSSLLDELLPEEADQLGTARAERVLEFRAGRHCARRAMASLGLAPGPVLRAPDRAPIFPEGVVGSITHTRAGSHGWCAAAVARVNEVRAVGIDVEPSIPLEPRVYRRVLTASERGRVEAAESGGLLAKLVFSAKEATYKCQYGITRQFLDFHDVEVVFDTSAEEFSATLLRAAGTFPAGHVFHGRAARFREWLGTGVVC